MECSNIWKLDGDCSGAVLYYQSKRSEGRYPRRGYGSNQKLSKGMPRSHRHHQPSDGGLHRDARSRVQAESWPPSHQQLDSSCEPRWRRARFKGHSDCWQCFEGCLRDDIGRLEPARAYCDTCLICASASEPTIEPVEYGTGNRHPRCTRPSCYRCSRSHSGNSAEAGSRGTEHSSRLIRFAGYGSRRESGRCSKTQ